MRRLSGSLLVLTCAVAVLGVGSLLPRLAFADQGVGAYSGEKKAFAKLVLVDDLTLREWPFPVDPTVARRVTGVSGTPDADSQCTSGEVPKGSPFYTGYFAGDYRAEVIHHGPFFIPTGKNFFNCDGASTYSFFLPRDVDGLLFSVLGPAVFMGAFGLAIGTVFVSVFLMIGGGILLVRGSERKHKFVGLAAELSGLALAATVFFAVATTAI